VNGQRREVLPLLMLHRSREPGTLQFEIPRPKDDDSKVLIYEVYKGEPAFKAHWNGPLVALVRKETEGMIGKISGTFCESQEAPASTIPLNRLNASNDE
jgi:quinol monooxygenase YgiN